MRRIYLDYAATTPTHPDVVRSMLPYFTESFGNPSSIYGCGQDAKEAVEAARASVAALIGARDEEIVFMSIRIRAITSSPRPLSTTPSWKPATFWKRRGSR